MKNKEKVEELFKELLENLEDNCGGECFDESMSDTPRRVAKMWGTELLKGYHMHPNDVIKLFPNTAKNPEEIEVSEIPFYSMCEHHMMPFFGKVSIKYIPGNYVLGLSKLPRMVEIYACRFQLQERLGQQIADAIVKYGKARSAEVIIVAEHTCMTARGIKSHGSLTTTKSTSYSTI
ncbi:MAG: GTP cyclohydrolase I [Fusobacteria bacterium]|nr:GTP cyclohydrolase I [Fusobacteriota bacterium]